jgi:transcriptional regulator with XRE-family HTH domain
MRFADIGQQLRAYRLESGLRAEEIAARLGVSRAALYRYEKGEVIKLDTIRRLAELLKISPLSLLGIGVEYFSRPVAFQERLRQVEEGADQILLVPSATRPRPTPSMGRWPRPGRKRRTRPRNACWPAPRRTRCWAC